MSLFKLLANFTGGEMTPLLDARIDLQKYDMSCRSLKNMRVLPYGGARFRAGTLFVAEAKYSDRPARILAFNFSSSTAYAIELGDQYMRFYRLVGPVVNPAFWIRTSAYTAGVYVQWNGITYLSQVAISSTTPPVYNNSPDVDTTRWTAIKSYQLVQLTAAGAGAAYWISSQAYALNDLVQWMGIIYKNILAISGTIPPVYNNNPALDATHWQVQTSYEIASPYTATDLAEVQFKQLNDVVYFVHPNYPLYKLSRTTPVSFTMLPVDFKYPPMGDENSDGVTTIALSGLSGSVTMTASAALFNVNHIGSFWEVKHIKESVSATLDISATSGTTYSSAVEVVGGWNVATSQTWYGTLNVQRSEDGGTTWNVLRQIKSISNHNATISGTENAPNAGRPKIQLRLQYVATGDPYGAPPWVGTVPNSYVKASAYLEIDDAYQAALVKVTGYTDSTHLTVTIINGPYSTVASTIWSEGAWSASRGYPRAIGLFEQRMIFAGTASKPNSFWECVAGDFQNFLYSDLDDGAIAYQPARCQQNLAAWVESLEKAYMGTSGEIIAITSGNENEPQTPANTTAKGQAQRGSANIQPVVVGKAIIFIERQGQRVRELIEGNPFLEKGGPAPTDLTLLAEHITKPKLIDMAVGFNPDQNIYCVRADGVMAVLTYDKEQNVTAWAPWDTQGRFVSVCALNGSPADVIVTVVDRVLPAGVKKYIEVFTAENSDLVTGINGMDATLYQEQASSTTVANLGHLEGLKVAVVADGAVIGDTFLNVGVLTVTGGQVTLPNGIKATKVRVGLPYYGVLQPNPIDLAISNGTTQGRKKRVEEIHVRFHETLGCSYGNATVNNPANRPPQFSTRVDFRTQDSNFSPVSLFTGDKILPIQRGAGYRANVVISQTQPLPMTVLGIFAALEVFGD